MEHKQMKEHTKNEPHNQKKTTGFKEAARISKENNGIQPNKQEASS